MHPKVPTGILTGPLRQPPLIPAPLAFYKRHQHSTVDCRLSTADEPCIAFKIPQVLLDAGCLDKPLVFMLNDTQIAQETFLEDVNNILNTGEVPNLMQNEDMERIMSSVSLKVVSRHRLQGGPSPVGHRLSCRARTVE